MNLYFVDWIIILGVLSTVVGSAIYVRRYTRSVADFLSANRCAGRYMLTVADGIAGLGAITIVATWEKFYEIGFAGNLWTSILSPLMLILAMTGWIIYRYRQTRAMTLAQFLEMRYSRNFRIFAGMLCFTSGVLNYGIFPAVTGRFLIYFVGLPIYTWTVPGVGLELNLTLGVVMATVLTVALLVTLNGGQIAVMVSDFMQGQLANICFLVLLVVILWLIPWSTMMETLRTAPEGQSKLNPFEQNGLESFNPLLFIMLAVLGVYQYRVWQGSQAYNSSARSPHEAKMANVLSGFRAIVQWLLIPLAAIAAWVLLNGDVLPEEAAAAHAQLDAMRADGKEQLARQLTTTIAMKEMLPRGVFGLLAAMMIMAAVSTDSTYLHSWGSIFVQDVVAPVREKMSKPKLSPGAHLKMLRYAVLGVAVFGWCFSMVFPLQEYITMYLTLTGAVFTGGAGAVLIGGLYWRLGTTRAAWCTMILGSLLSITGIVLINLAWPTWLPWFKDQYPDAVWLQQLPEVFWFNGVQFGFGVAIVSIFTYVIVSLLTYQQAVDFDKLFHRGKYSVAPKEGEPDYVPKTDRSSVPWVLRSLGVTEEFTRGDRWIFGLKYALFGWTFGVGFVVLTTMYLFGGMRSDDSWILWWTIKTIVAATLGTIAVVWFLIGGFRDMFAMFRQLKNIVPDAVDDGTVTVHLGTPVGDEASPDKEGRET
ncbi:MAG: sodium:solute symporter [Planctomycetota bacterium]